jgi:hypothetical protein
MLSRHDRRLAVKISPKADYPVGVRPRSWEELEELGPHYEGIYDVCLNGMVTVTFVPDVSAFGPPFDPTMVPDDLDQLASSSEARLAALFLASYAVTPNDELTGTWVALPALGPPGQAVDPTETGATVFFVDRAEFDPVAEDLAGLSQRLGGRHPDETVSQLGGHPAIELIQSTVLASPAFSPRDRAWLSDEPA